MEGEGAWRRGHGARFRSTSPNPNVTEKIVMVTKNNSRTDNLAADQSMVAGIQKNLAKLPPSFPLEGQSTTPAAMVQVYQDRIATGQAVVEADAVRAATVKTDKEKRAQTRSTALAFKRLVIAMFTQQPDVLGTFGLHAPKPAAKTAAEKAQAAAKAKATRAVLGTKGKKQKKAALEVAAAQTAAPAHPAAPAAAPAPKPAS
jgi:hypothetical protein